MVEKASAPIEESSNLIVIVQLFEVSTDEVEANTGEDKPFFLLVERLRRNDYGYNLLARILVEEALVKYTPEHICIEFQTGSMALSRISQSEFRDSK